MNIYPSDVKSLLDLLDSLNEEQRLLLLDRYCVYCGTIKLENESGEVECLNCMEAVMHLEELTHPV